MTNQSTLPTVKKFILPAMLLAAVLALPVMSASASTDKGTEKVTDVNMENVQYEIDMKELGINLDEGFTFEFGGFDEDTKNIPFNKTHVLVEKETFDSMNKVIKETKKAIEITIVSECRQSTPRVSSLEVFYHF